MSPDERRATALATGLGAMGVLHFVAPRFFDPIVPDWMPGEARTTTYASGVFELASAVLVAMPSTRKLGGWLSAVTIAGVYPANIQAALDGGMKGAPPPFDSAAAAWARLPMQIPMIRLAVKVARSA